MIGYSDEIKGNDEQEEKKERKENGSKRRI